MHIKKLERSFRRVVDLAARSGTVKPRFIACSIIKSHQTDLLDRLTCLAVDLGKKIKEGQFYPRQVDSVKGSKKGWSLIFNPSLRAKYIPIDTEYVLRKSYHILCLMNWVLGPCIIF